MSNPLVIIVNYRSAELTINSVRALIPARATLPNMLVHVVENDSGDAERLQNELQKPEFTGWVKLTLAPRNGGFAYGNNLALREAFSLPEKPDFIFMLNPDAEVRPLALENLIEYMRRNPQIGIAGTKLENADGSDWNWAFRFPNIFAELDNGLHLGIITKLFKSYVVAQPMGDEPTQVDWLPGAAMLVKREVFERIGLMDETYFLYYEETDFCFAAAQAGFECWYYPGSRVMHLAGQSTGVTTPGMKPRRLPAYWFESRRRYFIKNHGLVYATGADIAYIAGATLSKLRLRLQGRQDSAPPRLILDLMQHFSLLPHNQKIDSTKNW